jgi:hypothetical protein
MYTVTDQVPASPGTVSSENESNGVSSPVMNAGAAPDGDRK